MLTNPALFDIDAQVRTDDLYRTAQAPRVTAPRFLRLARWHSRPCPSAADGRASFSPSV